MIIQNNTTKVEMFIEFFKKSFSIKIINNEKLSWPASCAPW